MEKELHQAFQNKEKADLFLNNLENLLSDGMVNEVSYNSLKSEYGANLQHAQATIDHIKYELVKQLNFKSHELGIYQQELANLEARFKVGQLTASSYMKLAQNPQKKARLAEREISHFRSMIDAQSSKDINLPPNRSLASFLPFVGGMFRKDEGHQLIVPGATAPYKPPKPASTTVVTGLMILPDRVLPGSTVGVIATIINSGQEAVHHKVEFKINDKIESISDVTLDPGQNKELTFMTVAGVPGDYSVSVDNASGILRVMSTT